MTTQQNILWAGAYLVELVAVIYFTRATAQRVIGANARDLCRYRGSGTRRDASYRRPRARGPFGATYPTEARLTSRRR